ncbi:hypothetical protein [Streptococcus chenjunshii]|uniref:hypothetical protein n=1 Tax=Streptococcus chenjunshii TaxID=2173853 RepID=UPI001F546164|nr:hypothetical protein [Streptococcus chenjunshii]
MMFKIIKLLAILSVSAILVSCGLLNPSDKYVGSRKLTVTNIHDSIVLGETTKEDLVNWFGKPDKKIEDSSKAVNLYKEDNGDSNEGGSMDLLDEYTDFFETEKIC